MTMPFKAVFFDLDGTLVDTAPDLVGALNWVCHLNGQPLVAYSRARSRVSHGATALILEAFPKAQGSELDHLREQLLAYYQAHIAEASMVFEGLEMSLEALKAQQIPWGVITNKPTHLAQSLMHQLGLDHSCQVLFGGDSFEEKKPHPRPLLEAALRLNQPAQACVFIGDHIRDIQAAKAAGMSSISVGFGYHAPDENPLTWRADYHIETPHALYDLLKD
jgi:phosphoglycolate phosphatase